jgi:hypothetical protein
MLATTTTVSTHEIVARAGPDPLTAALAAAEHHRSNEHGAAHSAPRASYSKPSAPASSALGQIR